MITVLSGGTGTPKLLQGIKEVVCEEDINVVVNTLENNYFSGVYVSADIDTVLYTMSNLINDDVWYGRKDDTFITHNELEMLGYHEKLRLGDKDRALKIQKTELLKKHTLTECVQIQKEALGIKANIYPMSNQQPNVTVKTEEYGDISFHDFLISYGSEATVLDVVYDNVEASDEVLKVLEESRQVIIGPSNPITSINPIIGMNGVVDLLKDVHVTAISPIVGEVAVSGPAGKFLSAKGYDVSPVGVAKIYEEFLDHYIINTTDDKYKSSIKEFIPEVSVENIILNTISDKINLARKILL
ncbi:MAG: 2-phospho-L-lactate transferase [Methanosphaera sp. rholeuAM6]|nr:MAG: 2-phospho-L-lactate transferase [Methanosphaera sp. rholeuAM6]